MGERFRARLETKRVCPVYTFKSSKDRHVTSSHLILKWIGIDVHQIYTIWDPERKPPPRFLDQYLVIS
jgi:hypothetical protein